MAKLSPQMWLYIERDYMDGYSKAALSSKYGIARQSIQDHFRSRPHLLPKGAVVAVSPSVNIAGRNPAAVILVSPSASNIPAAAAPPNSHYPIVPPYIPPDTPIEAPKKSVILLP